MGDQVTQILIAGVTAQHAVNKGTAQAHANYHQKKLEQKMAYNKRLKLKLHKNQSEQNLPEGESSSQVWADSLSDGETVIDINHAEDSLEESSEDGHLRR